MTDIEVTPTKERHAKYSTNQLVQGRCPECATGAKYAASWWFNYESDWRIASWWRGHVRKWHPGWPVPPKP